MTRRLHDLFRRWTSGERSLSLWLYGLPAAAAEGLYRIGAAVGRSRYPEPHALPPQVDLTVVTSPLVGGVGKSPLVAHLAEGLRRSGRNTIIMTRGHRRRGEADLTLDPDDRSQSPGQTGDEPLMLARSTGCKVMVSADPPRRLQTEFGDAPPTWVLLDDGIRNRWQGERRIVVFADSDLESPVRLLPYGRWRVTPATMWPAAGVAVTMTEAAAPRQAVHREFLERIGHHGPIGWYRRSLGPLAFLSGGAIISGENPDGRPLAFCGLGMPMRFWADLRTLGINPVAEETFPDHHPYSESQLLALCRRCEALGGRWLLTTHKDAIKINPAWKLPLPVHVLRISLELAAGDDMLSLIPEPAEWAKSDHSHRTP